MFSSFPSIPSVVSALVGREAQAHAPFRWCVCGVPIACLIGPRCKAISGLVSPHSLGDLPSSWRAVVQIFAVRASWPVARHCFRSPRMEGFTEILRALWPASVIRQKRTALTKGHYGIRLSPATAGARNAGPARPTPTTTNVPILHQNFGTGLRLGPSSRTQAGRIRGAMLVQAYLPTTI